MSINRDVTEQQKPRIIVLENSQVFSDLLKSCILSWFRHAEVIAFENGDAAWQEIIRQEPDLLMTDRIHAGISGEVLLEKLTERQVRFPILLLASDLSITPKSRSQLRLIQQPKPFNRFSFWQTLNELVGPCDFPAFHPNRNDQRNDHISSTAPEVEEKPCSCL